MNKKERETEMSSNILSKDSMVMLLKDMYLVESAISIGQQKGLNKDNRIVKQYYNHLFAFYEIDSLKFHKSLIFYTHNPDIFENIYSEVINELSLEQSKIANE